ncbi:hypothetical protein BCR32DRAFT_271870 [Anaeromyces robustus]|uniref:Condensation domain-containing protein n=1 Tax=Anaeromyces robustus TaxID=1754192 RepID=A0A1Y1WPM7_9FUNG|nr:hypothetical protein BCR32DRAFT_271870 [Anaeromyces robustus]|eukprot:ORX75491.1 hypothetical protein BCR32DRAFT_271870 [Anaeromyces robustus]
MYNNGKQKIFKYTTSDVHQGTFLEKKITNIVIRFIIKLNGKLDIERFKQTVQLTIEKFPIISCKFYEHFFSAEWKFQEYPIEDFVVIEENKNNNEETENELLMKYYYKDLDYKNGPQVRFAIIQSSDHDSLCITINHMICDGVGFKEFLYMFCDLYTYPEHINNYPEIGDRSYMQLFKNLTLKEKWNILTTDMVNPFKEVHLDLKGDLNRPFVEIRSLTEEDYFKLKEYSKAKGVTLNDLFFTAMMRTLYNIFNRTVGIICDINLRKFLKDKKTECITNMSTALDCRVGDEIGDTFEETLNKVSKSLGKQKNDITCTKGDYLLEIFRQILPYRLVKFLLETFTPVCSFEMSNLGIIDKSKTLFKNVQPTSVIFSGSTVCAPIFEFSASTYDNIITFSVNLYGTPEDQKVINDVLDNYIKELTSII